MRRFSLLCSLFLLAGTLAPAPAERQSQSSPPKETRKSEALAPGIEHLEILRGDFASEPGTDRWIINVLVVEPKSGRLTLARALDEVVGAETTSSLAIRHGALAAVNGGYFRTTGTYRGEPTGMLELGEKVLSEPSPPRSELAITNAGGAVRIAVAQIGVKTEIVADGRKTHAADGINRPREENEMILFTPEFHRTTLTDPGGIEIIVERGRVTAAFDGEGSRPIPSEGYVLSAAGAAGRWAREHLRLGARVEVRTEITSHPPLPFAPEFIIGGGPLLVAAGRSLAAAAADAEQFKADFSQARHPRTAVGVRAEGSLVFVTVDGRQPKKSVGMTVDELAGLMLELGCVDAINLDGGGSTTMVVKGRVVNNPSDTTGERPVSDALLIFRRWT
jgi:hypothetical protein